ncbi:astacin [Ancylostoma duodenale]|uniref:Zinc metalloproteinase n=1 Tax=Ancylostoma duodenale TaxID=51022 RepID=A0A0C2FP41_9BILA|nr:astacin [Ancylostoma duodenale]
MRLLFLVLLSALCANAGFFDTRLGQKIKEALGKIKDALNSTALVAIRQKFNNLKENIKAKLALSPARKAILEELLKHIRKIKKDRVQEEGDSIEEINEKTHVAELLYQGDIVLTRTQAEEIVENIEDDSGRIKRQMFRDYRYPKKAIWENNTIHYYFNWGTTNKVKRVFRKGAGLWQKDTCIDFIEDYDSHDRILVFIGNGCWSYIGRRSGEQGLSLGIGCDTRDWLDQFALQTQYTNENYGLPYDYGNIMHYGANSASWNGQPTMVPNDPKYMETLGSPIISFYELLMINKHYGCDSKNISDVDSLAQAKHLFDTVQRIANRKNLPNPDGCGAVYEATTEYKTFRDVVGNKTAGQRAREDFDFCYNWIKVLDQLIPAKISDTVDEKAFQAPKGSKIEVKIAGLSKGLAVDGCLYWGVEIKTQADQRLTGYRFCAPEDVGVTLKSASNIVPIITYNRFYATMVDIQYRIVPGGNGGKPKRKSRETCADSKKCALLKGTETRDFCNSTVFTDSIKKSLCAKTCGYCD